MFRPDGIESRNMQEELSKQTPRVGPETHAHYKGPLDHLFIARYACFVQYGLQKGGLSEK